MYILPVFLPFLSFILLFFFGFVLKKTIANFIASLLLGFSLSISIFIFYEVAILGIPYELNFFNWFAIDYLDISWIFLYDTLTSSMCLVIFTVSFCAHIYSIEYMSEDPYQTRFMSYLSLFTFFMAILITSENVIQLFVGWEGVGICSYLLINFWYTRMQANKSALLAVFLNKVGDITLMISISILLVYFKTVSFYVLYNFFTIDMFELFYLDLTFLGALLVIAAVGKSAQLGLHLWLPEAMEGPTPVSSLIHAATMVTAGIFLILRMSFLFNTIPDILITIFFWGALTSLFSSLIGIMQSDLKKVIAYSTCSQLAYMFAACGLTAFNFSFFHLFSHAFFKALLFLTAGYIIHTIYNEQDIRGMCAMSQFLPSASIFFTIGSIALTGVPFFSGFYSKEKIIDLLGKSSWTTLFTNTQDEYYVYFMANFIEYITVFFSIFYSVKLFILVFQNKKQNNISLLPYHYSQFYIIVSLFLLFFFTMYIGYVFSDFFIGASSLGFKHSLFIDILQIQENSVTVIGLYNLEFNTLFNNFLIVFVLFYFVLISDLYIYSEDFINDFFNIDIAGLFFSRLFMHKFIYIQFLLDSCSMHSYRQSLELAYKRLDKGIFDILFISGPTNIILKLILFLPVKSISVLYFVHFFTLIFLLSNTYAIFN